MKVQQQVITPTTLLCPPHIYPQHLHLVFTHCKSRAALHTHPEPMAWRRALLLLGALTLASLVHKGGCLSLGYNVIGERWTPGWTLALVLGDAASEGRGSSSGSRVGGAQSIGR